MQQLIKLGVSGDIGSFSEEAGINYAKKSNLNISLVHLIDMEGVLAAVENEKVDLGILPVVNLQGGLVRMAYDAMGRHNFKVIDEFWLTVNQCLLAKPGITADQIRQIVSHSQAIAQCERYLQMNFHSIPFINWQDTAKAARELAQGKLESTTAVIAPAQAASIYGLDVIAKNIQDVNPNLTAFIIVKNYGNQGVVNENC